MRTRGTKKLPNGRNTTNAMSIVSSPSPIDNYYMHKWIELPYEQTSNGQIDFLKTAFNNMLPITDSFYFKDTHIQTEIERMEKDIPNK